MRSIPAQKNDNVLLGIGDDAAIVGMAGKQTLVQTIDYISPVVNDPYGFGQVAAANALSDIYAMGGVPGFALNLIGFPVNTLPMRVMEEILRGGADKLQEAGVSIIGGHSYEDHAPKYGLCVTGYLDSDYFVTKKGAEPGDVLILTKPVGIGAITTGIDLQLTPPDLEEKVLEIMTALNKGASEAMMKVGVHACTDVTGFGLLGHLYEMATAGSVSVEIRLSKVPSVSQALELIEQGAISNGTKNNRRMLQDKIKWDSAISDTERWLLYDSQTSGGLLIAVSPEKKEALVSELQRVNCMEAAEIGEIHPGNQEASIHVAK